MYNKKILYKLLGLLSAMVLAMSLVGCTISLNTDAINGTEDYSYRQDKLADNERVDLLLEFGVGELTLSSTDTHLIDSHFLYSHQNLKPEIKIDESSPAYIEIKHSGRVSTNISGFVNRWNVNLQEQLRYNMVFKLGVGSTTLDLSNFSNIESAKIETGVGESTILLSSNPQRSYTVNVEAGIGQTTIYYPEHVGMIVKAKQGLGSLNIKELTNNSELGAHVNDAFGKSDITIELSIEQGIGEVSLIPINEN